MMNSNFRKVNFYQRYLSSMTLRASLNPIAFRKDKIVSNFGHSECNWVEGKNFLPTEANSFL